jgi:phosphoribosyl 1,2-cyclic phosphodiesterase
MANRLQVKFWGVRGSIPTPVRENLGFGGNTTCLEVRTATNDIFVIDAGTGVRGLGDALLSEFAGQKIELRFLLTHFHWDHIQGMPFFAPLYSGDNYVSFLSGIPPERVKETLEGQMVAPYFPVPFNFLGARQDFIEVCEAGGQHAGITIRSFPMNHPQGAVGYRFEAGGAVVVHASDFEHGHPRLDGVLRDFAQDADVLICDSQFTPAEYEFRKGWGHSTWMECTRVARDAGVKRLILFHHAPEHGDQAVADIEREARRCFENTDAAREGWSVSV